MSNDILIVDDESDIRTLLCGILEDEDISREKRQTQSKPTPKLMQGCQV